MARLPPVLTVAFPAAAFDTNCYVLRPGAGEECVVVDPGIGVEETAARRCCAEHRLRPAAVLLTHGHIDHVYSVTPVCGADTAAYIHADDRYRLRGPAGARQPGPGRDARAAVRHQGDLDASPSTSSRSATGPASTWPGCAFDVLHAPGPHRGLGDVRASTRCPDGVADQVDVDRTVLSGDVLFAGSIGRTDLPGGDPAAMSRSPARRRAAAARTPPWCSRGTTGRHDDGPRAGHQPLPARIDASREDHPDQRLPRVPAGRADRRAALPRRHPRDLRAARVPLDRDPRRRARRPAARQGRGRRQGDLRRHAASPADETRRATPSWACTSTSPCRSPATSWRTPATSPSRSAATRSRRCGAASGRRRAATASSPRPTSTSSTSGELAPHFEAEMPLVIAEVFRKLPVGQIGHPGQQPQDPRGLLPRASASTDVGRHPAHRRQARQDRARQGHGRSSSRPGRTPGAGRPVPRAGRDPLRRTCPSSSGCAPSASSTRPSTRASTPLAARHPGRDGARARARSSPTCRSPAASTTTPAPSTRPSSSGHESWGSFCSGGRYDSLASDGRTTYPGVGISIGVSRLLGLLVGQRAAHGQPLDPGLRPRRRQRRGEPRRLHARGRPRCARAASRARWRPSAAKFGKQIRYAERRGIPFVWFPGAGEDAATRSRTSAPATRSTPTPPPGSAAAEDLRPPVVTP